MFFTLKKILKDKYFYTGGSVILLLGVVGVFSYFVTDSSAKITANIKRISTQIEKHYARKGSLQAETLKQLHKLGIAREIPCLTEKCLVGQNVYSNNAIYNTALIASNHVAEEVLGYSFVLTGLSQDECISLATWGWEKRFGSRQFLSFGVDGCPLEPSGIGVYHTSLSAPTKEEFIKACQSFNSEGLGHPIPDNLSDCYRFILNVSFN